jgi:hypothetical protein
MSLAKPIRVVIASAAILAAAGPALAQNGVRSQVQANMAAGDYATLSARSASPAARLAEASSSPTYGASARQRLANVELRLAAAERGLSPRDAAQIRAQHAELVRLTSVYERMQPSAREIAYLSGQIGALEMRLQARMR